VHTTFGRKVARTERPDQRAYVVPVKQTVLTRHRLRSRMARSSDRDKGARIGRCATRR
jgi:hypothetical protein